MHYSYPATKRVAALALHDRTAHGATQASDVRTHPPSVESSAVALVNLRLRRVRRSISRSSWIANSTPPRRYRVESIGRRNDPRIAAGDGRRETALCMEA